MKILSNQLKWALSTITVIGCKLKQNANESCNSCATVVQQLCKSCRTCFKFYCMFYFTCDRYFNTHLWYVQPAMSLKFHPGESDCLVGSVQPLEQRSVGVHRRLVRRGGSRQLVERHALEPGLQGVAVSVTVDVDVVPTPSARSVLPIYLVQ